MKRLKSISGKWMPTIILVPPPTTCYFVLSSRVYPLEQKDQLAQQEQKLITQEEAGTPIRTQHVSPASAYVGAAYLWIIPFGILGVCSLILYIVCYLVQLSFYGSCIVDYTKACYTEATRKCDNMKLDEARPHATSDCRNTCME